MKKNMIKVLAMAAATVMLTGCGNQYAEDISAIFGDGMQVAEAVKVKVTEEVKVVKEPKIVEETEPKVAAIDDVDKGAAAEAESASTTSPAEAKPESTAKPAETKPTAATAPAGTKPAATTPSAGQKSAPAFQCLCGFAANTEEELYNHIISETFGPGTEAQPVVTKPVETQPTEAQPAETTHEHVWQEHSSQRWVPKIVTVVDEPAQYEECSTYRMYWYDTNTWEETRDPARFDAWMEDYNGGLWLLFNDYEDSPLFLGYNDQGTYSLIGDHAIITGYECVSPEVTHEEDQGYYETYVDYYYCDCGATK